MNANATAATTASVNPLFVRHDLMIEMARLEMEIDDLQIAEPKRDSAQIIPLQQRIEKISHVLSRVPM